MSKQKQLQLFLLNKNEQSTKLKLIEIDTLFEYKSTNSEMNQDNYWYKRCFRCEEFYAEIHGLPSPGRNVISTCIIDL